MHIDCLLMGDLTKDWGESRRVFQHVGPGGWGWGFPQAPISHPTGLHVSVAPAEGIHQDLGSPSGSLLAWKVWDL